MSELQEGKFRTYTAPVSNGFRIRADTAFANDRDLDKAWEMITGSLLLNKEVDRWDASWGDPHKVLEEIRVYFECNNVYDIMRLGNEAVFLKFQRTAKYATHTLRPRMSVRELVPRKFWTIELVDKDLLEWVDISSLGKGQ